MGTFKMMLIHLNKEIIKATPSGVLISTLYDLYYDDYSNSVMPKTKKRIRSVVQMLIASQMITYKYPLHLVAVKGEPFYRNGERIANGKDENIMMESLSSFVNNMLRFVRDDDASGLSAAQFMDLHKDSSGILLASTEKAILAALDILTAFDMLMINSRNKYMIHPLPLIWAQEANHESKASAAAKGGGLMASVRKWF